MFLSYIVNFLFLPRYRVDQTNYNYLNSLVFSDAESSTLSDSYWRLGLTTPYLALNEVLLAQRSSVSCSSGLNWAWSFSHLPVFTPGLVVANKSNSFGHYCNSAMMSSALLVLFLSRVMLRKLNIRVVRSGRTHDTQRLPWRYSLSSLLSQYLAVAVRISSLISSFLSSKFSSFPQVSSIRMTFLSVAAKIETAGLSNKIKSSTYYLAP